MAPTYPLRQTDLAFNRNQLRDSHGRWSLVGAVESRVTRLVSSDEHGSRSLTRVEVRRSLTLQPDERADLYESAGFSPHYKESETDLAGLYLSTTDSAKRDDIKAELLRRQDALNSAMATVHEAELASRRGERRKNFTKYDAHLQKSRLGRALLKVRDRFISDKTFDAAGAGVDRAKEYGKDWGLELASSGLASTLVGAAASLSSVLIGEHAPEAIQHFVENPLAETGVITALSLGIGFGLAAVRKHAAKKATLKRRAEALSQAPDLLSADYSGPKVTLKT